MTSPQDQIADFEIILPDEQIHPVVFNSPHSGTHYRDDFIAASRLKPLALQKSQDSFVDQLFGHMPNLGCPLLKANFPRAFLDVNRGPWELDPKMFADQLPSYVETKTLRVISGLGTIARNVSETEKIYRKKLLFADAKARIERYYFPYHQALQDLINTTRDQFGQTLLIDCHSMPSSAASLTRTRSKRPDIILGDRFGTACNSEFVDHLQALFDASGLTTTRNKPYAGGHITQTYGRPFEDVHVIQIEISRSLYMDEKAITKTGGFDVLQKTLTDILNTFLQTVPLIKEHRSLAAE